MSSRVELSFAFITTNIHIPASIVLPLCYFKPKECVYSKIIVIQTYLLYLPPFCLGKMKNSLCFQAIITFFFYTILSPKMIKLGKGIRVIILQHLSPSLFDSSFSFAYLDKETRYCSICVSLHQPKADKTSCVFADHLNTHPNPLPPSSLNSIIINQM